MDKKSGQVLGIVLLIIGGILFILGFIGFFAFAAKMDLANPAKTFAFSGIGMIGIFIGFVIAGVGGLILYFANIGKISSYMAGETASGIEKTTHAVGKGLASGVKKGLKSH